MGSGVRLAEVRSWLQAAENNPPPSVKPISAYLSHHSSPC